MITLPLLKDLYGHMKWADSQIWTAIKNTPSAQSDEALRERMFHIHYTQHVFLQAWKKEDIAYARSTDYPTFDSIEQLMINYYQELPVFVESVSEKDLSNTLVLPWTRFFERTLGKPAVDTTLGETMYQIASHSVHHRAQVNLQIRENDGDPPMIDYIVWLWRGRPEASFNT